MRRPPIWLGLLIIAVIAGGMLIVSPAPLAWAQKKAPLPPGAAEAAETPKPEAYQQFTFPEERDATQKLKAVLDYLEKKNVPWDIVCGTAQQLLDAKSDSFYPTEATGKKGGNRVSIKTKINELIGGFPKEGRQFYELNYGAMADRLLKEAVTAGYDRAKLSDVAQRYFQTRSGAQAALLLATLQLESGDYAEAAYGFQRLLDRPESDDFLGARILFRAAVAFKRSGDVRQGETVAKLMDRLEKKMPRDGLAIGKRTFSFEDLKQELDRPVDLNSRLGDSVVAMRYGNPSHTGTVEGGTPFLDAAFSMPMLYHTEGAEKDGADWVRDNVERTYKVLDPGKKQVPIPGFFPVTTGNLIIYRSYDGVYAVASRDGLTPQGKPIRAGELLWISPTAGGVQRLMSEEDRGPVQIWWQSNWAVRQPSILFENSLVGTLSHDGKYVYFVDDLGIPPPAQTFNPNIPAFQQQQQQQNTTGAVKGMSEFSRLVAVNIDTGKVEWNLGGLATLQMTDDEEQKSTNTLRLTEDALFLGPPLPVNGKLYVLFERKNQVRLACLDTNRLVSVPPGASGKPEKYPELVWIQNLGAPNTRLSTDSLRRIQPAFLAYSDGVLVCPTNSGAVIAVDVNARCLLWARYYADPVDPGRMPGNQPGGVIKPVPFPGTASVQPLPSDRWRSAAPIIAGGKVIVTAHDSNHIHCLDLRTGELLWSDDRKPDDLYVGGVNDDKVLVVGKESMRAYNLAGNPDRTKSIAWQNLRIGTPAGHGVMGKDGVYFVPLIGNPDQKDSKDPQVWAIEMAAGKVRSKTEFRRKDELQRDPRLMLGNLAFHDGLLFAQSADMLTAFPLIELKKQEMARLLKENPNDPVGLTARGELSLDSGDIADAIRDFKLAQKNDPPENIRRKIRQKLYIAYTELLRNKFSDGEAFLKEYETLCEVPVESDDPTEKQRLMDENVRRKCLYLSLVAKGREKQGRLVEAFDHYRAFAALGDNKQLVAIYDEPNGTTRPDIWARGRIDAMIRAATDPAIRKPLEDRVRADWEAVRSANDLTRLREFVKIFGPYFEVGREAQLLLAERLVQTNNEDDLREAQTQLMQLWATAEEPQTAVKSIEALARVLTRRGMLEDAVGLYSQLGNRFADVEVRDGKTGADLYGELITDKRLLPYLEPGRGPTNSKYKVEMNAGAQNRPGVQVQSFSLNPEGELFPFFRRLHLSMEMSQNGDGMWMMRAIDRVTGEDRCRFPGLSQMQTFMGGYNQGPPSYRLAQANGHLLLLNVGQVAYCFDLAEKRELWRYNLLGNVMAPANNPPRLEPTPDGDVLITYTDDGWTMRLGRSSLLQPTYACLVTRDGLVALDPATGQKLWVRTNVSPKVQVFGDARHIFLVEGNTSRVLRAVDGTQVDGIKDFSKLFTSPARIAVLGRQFLLSEGAGNEPRKLRLYDPLTGQDVWAKDLPAKAMPLKTLDQELTGYLDTEGKFEVLSSRTGKTLFQGALDANRLVPHLKDETGAVVVRSPLLLADAERYYLFLSGGNSAPNAAGGFTMIRSIRVDGPAYGFDKTTGRRLWYTDRLFENQLLLLDRFDELPVLVAANHKADEVTGAMMYQVAVLDKQLGKLRYLKSHGQNGFFVASLSDPKTRAIEFWRYDIRLRIAPDDEGRTER